MAINYLEVVKTVILEPIAVGGESLSYRIEIVINHISGKFSPILWRLETYRIQPTFPQTDGQPIESGCDEEILVRDTTTIDLESIEAADANSALQLSLQSIAAKFSPNFG